MIQIRSFVARQGIKWEEPTHMAPLSSMFLQARETSISLSKVVQTIMTSQQTKLPGFISKWDLEIPGGDSEKSYWEKIFELAHCPKDMGLKMANYRLISRINISANLGYMKNKFNCTWCNQNNATTEHKWWHCKTMQDFWGQIITSIREELGVPLNESAPLVLFSLGLEDQSPEVRIRCIRDLSMARLLISRKWQSSSAPTLKEWQLMKTCSGI